MVHFKVAKMLLSNFIIEKYGIAIHVTGSYPEYLFEIIKSSNLCIAAGVTLIRMWICHC